MSEKPTWERLAEALFEAGFSELGARARRGEFDDFRSPHAFPKIELVRLLVKRGQRGRDFTERIKAGEFDNTEREADAWAQSLEGRQTFQALLRGE